MRAPEFAEHRERGVSERHEAVVAPLAVNMNEPALAIDLRGLQVSTFEEAEPAGVDRGQAGAVDRNPHALEDVANLLARQYCGEPMIGRWPQESAVHSR